MNISVAFPAGRPALRDAVGEPVAVSYNLLWPTSLAVEEVVEVIRSVGDEQPDRLYHCTAFHDDMTEYIDALIHSEAALEELDDEHKPDIGESKDLDEVLLPRFDQLSVESGNLSFGWEDMDEDFGGAEFSLRSVDNHSVTEQYILDLIRRTIRAKHVGSTAVALETLCAIFEKFRAAPHEALAG